MARRERKLVANNKKVAIFAVGSSPIENPDVSKALDKINSDIEKKLGSKIETMKTFYCPGGLNYEKMNTPSKLAMKMFVSILKSNKNKTEKDEITGEDNTVIYYTDGEPHAEWYRKSRTYWWNTEYEYSCKIYIPEGTMTTEFTIDME